MSKRILSFIKTVINLRAGINTSSHNNNKRERILLTSCMRACVRASLPALVHPTMRFWVAAGRDCCCSPIFWVNSDSAYGIRVV